MGAGAKSISATRHVALHGHRHHRIVVHARVVILDGNDGALVTRIQRTNLRSAAVREEGGAKREAHGHDEDPHARHPTSFLSRMNPSKAPGRAAANHCPCCPHAPSRGRSAKSAARPFDEYFGILFRYSLENEWRLRFRKNRRGARGKRFGPLRLREQARWFRSWTICGQKPFARRREGRISQG